MRDTRAIFAVGDAEPRTAGAQDLDSNLAFGNQPIHRLGQVAFRFQISSIAIKELFKQLAQLGKTRGVNPHMFIETVSSPVRLVTCPLPSVFLAWSPTRSMQVSSSIPSR